MFRARPRFRFHGDKESAKSLYMHAWKHLNKMKETAPGLNQIGPFSLKFSNGVEYIVREVFGQPSIDIFVPPPREGKFAYPKIPRVEHEKPLCGWLFFSWCNEASNSQYSYRDDESNWNAALEAFRSARRQKENETLKIIPCAVQPLDDPDWGQDRSELIYGGVDDWPTDIEYTWWDGSEQTIDGIVQFTQDLVRQYNLVYVEKCFVFMDTTGSMTQASRDAAVEHHNWLNDTYNSTFITKGWGEEWLDWITNKLNEL